MDSARFFDMLNDNDFVILRIIRVGYFFREVFTVWNITFMLQIFLKDVDMLQKGYYNSSVNK